MTPAIIKKEASLYKIGLLPSRGRLKICEGCYTIIKENNTGPSSLPSLLNPSYTPSRGMHGNEVARLGSAQPPPIATPPVACTLVSRLAGFCHLCVIKMRKRFLITHIPHLILENADDKSISIVEQALSSAL